LLFFITSTITADTSIGTKVFSYTSQDGNSRLSLVRYGKKENQTYLAHYHNLNCDWDGQSILLHKEEGLARTAYDHLTPGRRVPIAYRSIIDSRSRSLIKGSLVPEIEVYAKGLSDRGIKMYLNDTPLMSPQEVLKHYNK
jgi:hypothetical protein